MQILVSEVELLEFTEGTWKSDKPLGDILAGGIENGLKLAFPDQRSPELKGGGYITEQGMFEPNPGLSYGSEGGQTIDNGMILGQVKGYPEGNELYVFTFDNKVDPPGIPCSMTTLLNDADENGTGVILISDNPEEHQDKYAYKGVWTRV